MIRRTATVAFSSLALLAACSSDGGATEPDDSVVDPATKWIEFAYDAGSLPPDVQRNYAVRIERDSATIVVTDFESDVLHEVSQPVDEEDFDDVYDAVMQLAPRDFSCDLDGGWSLDLTVSDLDDSVPDSDGADAVWAGHSEPCDDESRAYADEMAATVEPVVATFDLATLLAPGPVD